MIINVAELEGIPFPPSFPSLSYQVWQPPCQLQKSRRVRRILLFHIPPASEIQGNSKAHQWIFPRSDSVGIGQPEEHFCKGESKGGATLLRWDLLASRNKAMAWLKTNQWDCLMPISSP